MKLKNFTKTQSLVYIAVVFLMCVMFGFFTTVSIAQETITETQIENLKNLARKNPGDAIVQIDAMLSLNNIDSVKRKRLQLIKSYALYLSGEYTSAITLAKSLELNASKKAEPFVVARSQVVQGHILQAVGELDRALSNYISAIDIYKQRNAIKEMADTFNSVANVYLQLKEFDKAVETYRQIETFDHSEDSLASLHLGVGNAFYEQRLLNEAKEEYQLAMGYYQAIGDTFGIQLALTGLGHTEYELNNDENAEKYYQRTLAIAQDSGRALRLSGAYSGYARVMARKKNYQKAEEYFNKALDLAGNNLTEKLEVWKDITAFYKDRHMYEQALSFQSEVLQQVNKQANINYLSKIAVLNVLFELDKAHTRVALLSKENELQKLKLDNQRKYIVASVSATALILVIIIFIVYRRNQSRKLLEEKRINQKLREIDKIKDNVLANTSHELRTPLNGILGLSEIMLSDESTKLSEFERENLQIIHKSGERLLYLVEDIIDVSKIKQNRLVIDKKPTDLREILKDEMQLLKVQARQKGLILKFDLDRNIPLLELDGKRMSQVFSNLVKNAIKYSNKGEIVVSVKRKHGGIHCEVRDQGVGIPKDKHHEIFEPFERSNHGDYKNTEGAGLGLAIVKEILLRHNIAISVDSAPNLGSRFFFEIPYSSHAEI